MVVGLLDRNTGDEILPSQGLILKENEMNFTFNNIKSNPIASVLRGFSAPVKLVQELSDEDRILYSEEICDSLSKDVIKRAGSEPLLELPKFILDEINNIELTCGTNDT